VSRGHYVWQPHYQPGSQPFTRSDGHRFTGPGAVQGGAHTADGYRNGATSRSAGQQRHVAGDPDTGRAAHSDGRPPPHATLTEPSSHGQLTTREQVREELRARAGSSPGSAALRSPGQYRSGDAGSSHAAPPQRPDGQPNAAAGTTGKERAVGAPRTPGEYRGNAPAAAQQHAAPQPSARQPTTSQERFVVPNNTHVARPPAGDARSSSAAPRQPARAPGVVSPPPRAVTPNSGGAAAAPPRASTGVGQSYRSVSPGRGDDSSSGGRPAGSPSGAPRDGGSTARGPAPGGSGPSYDSRGGGGNPGGGGRGGGQSHGGGGHRGATR
jgi:translation initiation factor IF-2